MADMATLTPGGQLKLIKTIRCNVAQCYIHLLFYKSITHCSFSAAVTCLSVISNNSVALDDLQSIFHLELVKN